MALNQVELGQIEEAHRAAVQERAEQIRQVRAGRRAMEHRENVLLAQTEAVRVARHVVEKIAMAARYIRSGSLCEANSVPEVMVKSLAHALQRNRSEPPERRAS